MVAVGKNLSDQEIPKLYYSIGEVSRLTQVDTHVLRYWETEFRDLAPRKNRNGKRLYRETDVKTVLRIKELLYTQRFTIEGARKKLRDDARMHSGGRSALEHHPSDNHQLLEHVKKGLLQVRDLLK